MVGDVQRRLESEPDGHVVSPLGERAEGDYYRLDNLTDEEAMTLAVALGSKAKNLVYLRNGGLPVPAGRIARPSAATKKSYTCTSPSECRNSRRILAVFVHY